MAQPLVGNRLRRLRKQRAMTQVELADRLGISPSYLNLMEHNQRALTPPLLVKLSDLFDIDLQAFSGTEEAHLLAEMLEVFGDPLFSDSGLNRAELEQVVGAAPELARAVLALYRAYRDAQTQVDDLGQRLASDPFLETASHRLLTLITSVRSFSEILRDNVDLAATQRQSFVEILVEESGKLTELVNEVFAFIAGEGLQRPRGAESPGEEAANFLQRRGNHFPALERAAEALRDGAARDPADLYGAVASRLARRHGVQLRAVESAGRAQQARFDEEHRVLLLAADLPSSTRTFRAARQLAVLECAEAIDAELAEGAFASETGRLAARNQLAGYVAGAVLMPYSPFCAAARALRHDVDRLRGRFGVSFEQACHRLTTLQRPGEEGVPFHFLRVDIAGNVSKRFTASSLSIPRFGGICPRWNVHSAFLRPGHIDVQAARLPDSETFLFIARAEAKPGGGYHAPRSHYAVAIGCDISFADRVVYADGLDLKSPNAFVPVGLNCRQCPRDDCAQRAAPGSIHRSGGNASPGSLAL